MSKKIIVTVVLILVFMSNTVFASEFFYDEKWNTHYENVKLYFNDQHINTDIPSLIIENRTLVPVRAFFENLGADVSWDGNNQIVTIQTSKYNITLGINSYVAFVNGESVLLDVPAKIVTDYYGTARTLVPVRFISEQLGYKVLWDPQTYSVYVSEKNVIEYISQINTSVENNVDFIRITSTSEAKPVVTKMVNPERIILDFYGFQLTMGDGSLGAGGINYTNVRYANHAGYARIVIDTKNNYSMDVLLNGQFCTVKLSDKSDFSGNSGPVENTPVATPLPTAVPDNQTPEIFDKPVPGNGLVVIDPGHGGSDPGALGYKDGEVHLRESDANLDISLKLFELLKSKGVNVAITRTTDVYVGLKERAEFANNLNASLFICVHNNSATTPAAHGSMVYFYSGAGDSKTKATYGITSKELASMIHEEIISHGGRYDRKIADGSKFIVLYSTAMPAILAECAFISNDEERELLNTDEFRLKLAEGICAGVIRGLTQMGLYN